MEIITNTKRAGMLKTRQKFEVVRMYSVQCARISDDRMMNEELTKQNEDNNGRQF